MMLIIALLGVMMAVLAGFMLIKLMVELPLDSSAELFLVLHTLGGELGKPAGQFISILLSMV